ncbi:TIGR04222 domain-containing membrane protein [Dongia sp.]|uniref:TIGR04222 domain-containing membrane protein n=1 Tax=Dongia sp. TaxID=1977262 RepID=UPI003751062F
MNPFALHGGDFLLFYALVGLAGLAVQYAWTRLQESLGEMPQLPMTDPYQIAYLRGGQAEALRLVAFSLLDRGLLNGGARTLTAELGAEKQVRRPIEKAVLRVFRSPGYPREMQTDADAIDACRRYRDTLEDYGLVAGPATFARRLPALLVAAIAVVFVGLLKLFIALSEGRHNIGFLILMMIGFSYVAIVIFRRHRTKRGDDMMADLRMMFARLRDRSGNLGQGGATNEAALLAAVFGLSELSPARFPALRSLKPEKVKNSSNCSSGCSSCSSYYSSSSSCSSSSSSSSCSSGSSCGGGGGCGGGCGG